MPQLIIIRGNSGSGKSTIALRLRREMGYGTMLIPQDVTRREILRVRSDEPGNPNVMLMHDLALYGRSIGYDVIMEGILGSSTNRDMLVGLMGEFDAVHTYYLDIPFEETLKRHATKPKAHEFGEAEMREWWNEKDYLGVQGEKSLGPELSEDESVGIIMADVRAKTTELASSNPLRPL